MRKKRFLNVLIFSLMSMAAAGLVCSSAFGQIAQDVSLQWGDLFNSYTLDSSVYINPLTQSSSYDSTTTNPFATSTTQSSSYTDLFSTSWDQSSSYLNAFGFGSSSGSNFYSDPLYTTSGGYLNVGAPGALYSSEYDSSSSLLGWSNSSENSLILPWTTYSSSVSTSVGMDAWPFTSSYSGSSVALGTPTAYSYSGIGRYGEGIANLVNYAPVSAQMDQVLGDQRMYTAEGMPFYATASYFNPYSASNYYFAPGVKTSSAAITPVGYTGSSAMVTGATSTYGPYGYGGYAGIGSIGGGYIGGGYTGGGYAGGGYAGTGGVSVGTGSPAASGYSPAGFTSVVYP